MNRMTVLILVASIGPLASPLFAQISQPQIDDAPSASPTMGDHVRPARARSRRSTLPPRSGPGSTREAERAAALERGRRRFFDHVDEFGSDAGKAGSSNSLFPVGPDGLPVLDDTPKVKKR